MKLRSRTVQKDAAPASPGADQTSATGTRRFRVRVQWDLIFWMLASFATLYLSNFASNLLFNDDIKRTWLFASMLFLGVSVGCMVYAFRKHSNLSPSTWSSQAPVLVSVATATGISGGVCLTVAVWPVWKLLTLLILPTLFMGFISTVSLFNI